MKPNSTQFCGPYRPLKSQKNLEKKKMIDMLYHDTIGMIIIDSMKEISAGTSSNGARNKISG